MNTYVILKKMFCSKWVTHSTIQTPLSQCKSLMPAWECRKCDAKHFCSTLGVDGSAHGYAPISLHQHGKKVSCTNANLEGAEGGTEKVGKCQFRGREGLWAGGQRIGGRAGT